MSSLLPHARGLLDDAARGTVSSWPRAAALLGRQELEASLTRFWATREPALARVPMRIQLACLREYASDPAVAPEVSWTWHALSRATHHHPYELDPTREELASLLAHTERMVATLSQSSEKASLPR